jgi:hypothetical protein
MPETVCFQVPADHELETNEAWQRRPPNTFTAVRAHIVAIKRRGAKPLTGPPVGRIDVPAGSEYGFSRKDIIAVKHMAEIQELVQRTVSARVTEEFSEKISASIGVSGPLPTAKASSDTQFKAANEISDAVQRTLGGKLSFEVSRTTEIERSVTVKTSADGSRASPKQLYFYFTLWPWQWDFYLYKVELMRLKYEQSWYWWRVRETIASKVLDIRQPLFSLCFYQPEEDPSISDGEYVAEVQDADEIHVTKLDEPLRNIEFPLNSSLELIARVAFPVTHDERREAHLRSKKRSARFDPVVDNRPPKGPLRFAKKKSPRKSAAKKSARKSAAKKPARKSAAKKSAAKR